MRGSSLWALTWAIPCVRLLASSSVNDYLEQRTQELGREYLLINLDEAPVSRSPRDAAGILVTQCWPRLVS
mgnify:CR=1 FL=1